MHKKEDGLVIHCDLCAEILTRQGALLFSPPKDGMCKKIHICLGCYENLKKLLT